MDLRLEDGTLTQASQNRIQAVREQILSYKPDFIALQEDIGRWIDNINIDSALYTAYRPDVQMSDINQEYCSVYVKKGISVMGSGWRWLSAGNESVPALTYAELTNGDGKYDMTSRDLRMLGITDDASLKKSYTGTLIKHDGSETAEHSYGSKLAAHLMNWVVAEINGKNVIYVNTHFQHRGTDHSEYSRHPLYMLRYYERCAEFELMQNQIETLMREYQTGSVVITGDFNDSPNHAFYEQVAKLYTDSKLAAVHDSAGEDTWNSAFDVASQGQTSDKSDIDTGSESRIDFCFVSDALKNAVYSYRVGAYQWQLSDTGIKVCPSDHLPVVVELLI